MAQRYYTTFIAIGRQTTSDDWEAYPITDTTEVTEFSDKSTCQNAVIIDLSDGNQAIYHEMVMIPDATSYVVFDETYTPASGDPTYNTKYIALYQDTSSGPWSVYKGTGSTIIFSVDKNTFLNTLRQAYGDGRFRIFQETVQSHSHSFVTVP